MRLAQCNIRTYFVTNTGTIENSITGAGHTLFLTGSRFMRTELFFIEYGFLYLMIFMVLLRVVNVVSLIMQKKCGILHANSHIIFERKDVSWYIVFEAIG